MAKFIITQYGGPDGELGASVRYLSQRFAMPYAELKGLLTDIGTEELGHFEMIGTIVHQLTRDLSIEEIKKSGFDTYFVDHTTGIYPQAASGSPWTAAYIASKGDVITDLVEDMAAEQKARTTYDNILRMVDDPDVIDPIRFLRQREVVHFQRFGEGLRHVTDQLDSRNFYAFNPAFDRPGMKKGEMNKPEMIMPEMNKPEMIMPEMNKPEMVKPEMKKPEMVKPEMIKPEMNKPEMVKPEMNKPGMNKPGMNK
jgi:spore coat protein JC